MTSAAARLRAATRRALPPGWKMSRANGHDDDHAGVQLTTLLGKQVRLWFATADIESETIAALTARVAVVINRLEIAVGVS